MTKKVLVIERNELVADSRSDLLRDRGYDVTVGSVGAAWNGEYRGKSFDALFYNLDMTQNGIELIRRLREQHPAARIVVYSTPNELKMTAEQIAYAHAEQLTMIATINQIAAAL